MNGFQKLIDLGHLQIDGRRQRLLLGLVLLGLSLLRTDWLSASLPDYIATAIQLELIFTGAMGWCPLMAYKVYTKEFKDEKI